MTRSAAQPREARPDAAVSRTLAVIFPYLSAERLRATRPHLFVGAPRTAIAFVARARLVAIDAAAARAGLAVGMTVADAQARVPDMALHREDLAADHQWLEQLAASCERYSAAVTVRPPDALMLDFPAAAIAGDERSLVLDLEARLARRRLVARHAWGDGPAIAEALARFTGAPAPDEAGALRRLPLAALDPDGDAASALALAGMRQVGDVMALPTAAVAARFGLGVAARVRELARPAERRKLAPPEPPLVRIDQVPDPATAPRPALLATVTELATAAAARLAARGAGGRCWRMRLFRVDGTVESHVVDLDRLTADPAVPIRRLGALIGAMMEPVDDHRRIDLVRLEVTLIDPVDTGLLALDGSSRAAPTGRPRAVRRPRPAAPQAELPLGAGPSRDEPPPPRCPGTPARPIHLFDPPQPIEVAEAAPDGWPRRFRWRRRWHDVSQADGPEAIAPGAGHDACDYWRVVDRRGRALWIFRPRAADGAPPRWYIHGLFA